MLASPLGVWWWWKSREGGDVFQIWHVGCWTGNLLLPPHLRHLTGAIPTICKEFFMSPRPFDSPLPAFQTSRPGSQPAAETFFCFIYWIFHPPGAFWQALTLLSLCFSLTHSPGLCAGGMREQRPALRNHCAGFDIVVFLHSSFFPTHDLMFIAVSLTKLY